MAWAREFAVIVVCILCLFCRGPGRLGFLTLTPRHLSTLYRECFRMFRLGPGPQRQQYCGANPAITARTLATGRVFGIREPAAPSSIPGQHGSLAGGAVWIGFAGPCLLVLVQD